MQSLHMISTVEAVALTVLASVLSAWLTTVFAFRRFRAEKGWERRAQAYERIIRSLHQSKVACSDLLALEHREEEPSKEREGHHPKRKPGLWGSLRRRVRLRVLHIDATQQRPLPDPCVPGSSPA